MSEGRLIRVMWFMVELAAAASVVGLDVAVTDHGPIVTLNRDRCEVRKTPREIVP